MGDEALNRRETLRRVMRDRGLTYRDLERIVGGRYTYWRDLLAENSTKSFGEKAARKVEEKLDPPLPRGYLDHGGERETRLAPMFAELDAHEAQLITLFRLIRDPQRRMDLLQRANSMAAEGNGEKSIANPFGGKAPAPIHDDSSPMPLIDVPIRRKTRT